MKRLLLWTLLGVAATLFFHELKTRRIQRDLPSRPVTEIGILDDRPAPQETVTTPEKVFSAVSPSVVVIHAVNEAGQPIRQGSGVVISANGVVTARHVVEKARSITIRQGPAEWPAYVEYTDPVHDICVLSIPSAPLPPVTMADLSTLRTGQRVYAVAAPRGLELSIAEGLVSSLRPTGNTTYIQTSAPISPGSSGGGIFDTAGRLVGVISFTASGGQNLNFALPAELIRNLPDRSVPPDSVPPLAPRDQVGVPYPGAAAPPLSDDPSRRYQREAIDAAKLDIERIQADLKARHDAIDRINFSIGQQKSSLERLQARGDVDGSKAIVEDINRQIADLNQRVADFLSLKETERERVEQANRMVAEYNRQP
ncbi:MAG TPA: trypsin-like peptidase domain-containing protein [Candidatus Deferrimicrobiaceae bacterium]